MSGPYSWFKENPSVREAALVAVDLGGKPLPDALLADPLKLIDLSKAVVIEAVRRDAPDGVVEGLMVPVRRMVRFGSQIDQYRHVTSTLSQAQGLRDSWEMEPVFTKALETAPDDANRQMIQRMLDVLTRSVSPEELVVQADEMVLKPNGTDPGATELSPGTQCAICCGLACVLCELGCLACCVVGCVACGS